jgi:hypothetical protein
VRDERDELIGRIVDELSVLPAVPADATARVLARVGAARRGQSPAADADDDDIIFFPAATDEMQTVSPAAGRPTPPSPSDVRSRNAGGLRRRFVVSLPAAIGYALAATVAGFLIRGALPRASGPDVTASAPSPGQAARQSPSVAVTPVRGLTTREYQEAPVAVQFVLDARRARTVALVGDFNAWDNTSTPLTRDSVTGVWSTVVGVPPGRHVYAYVVDGEKWTLDPRAPKTKDSDYGTEQSVIIVGLP